MLVFRPWQEKHMSLTWYYSDTRRSEGPSPTPLFLCSFHLWNFCSPYSYQVTVLFQVTKYPFSWTTKHAVTDFATPLWILCSPVSVKASQKPVAQPRRAFFSTPQLCRIVLLLGPSFLGFSLECTSSQNATLISCLFPISQRSHYLISEKTAFIFSPGA